MKRFTRCLLFVLALVLGTSAQEPVDLDAVMRIRKEGFESSQVMDTVWHLTDLHGPRLTNSPQQRKAAAWARDRLTEFGLENAALEAWGEFGLGWSFERCVVSLVEPIYMPLIAIPKAWTPGTDGAVRGVPVLVEIESEEDLEKYKGQLAGKIVLNGRVNDVASHFEGTARRHDAESLAELVRAPQLDEDDGDSGRRSDWRRRRELRNKLRDLLKEEGALVIVQPDGGRRNDYGVIMVGSGGPRDPEEDPALPQVVVSTEHFNRIARLIQHDQEVVMEVDVQTTFYADDLEGHNVIAEIPGTDPLLRDEVVMLGGHFDSWHAGTGTTDNGASCAVAMEAVRIIQELDLKPRRTIRVALWTGEEQGLLGSRGYVKNHFADRDTMELLPEHEKLAAYFNMDNGSGKLRGVYLQGNVAVRPIFAAWLEPLADLDATTLSIRNTGGTDHLSFNAVGLSGFQFIQDPMDYSSRSHHTNMDLYERVHSSDVKQASVVMATFVWHAAQRDEMLPRKPLPEPRESDPEPEPEKKEEATPVEAGASSKSESEG
ncbi:MAG: M20/M25/M40 family metallo-hydrolase [Planctomycetota bacterium]|nr:M20/M25/M40 family metallo-hydrolase [Planctomycetota bacterium]